MLPSISPGFPVDPPDVGQWSYVKNVECLPAQNSQIIVTDPGLPAVTEFGYRYYHGAPPFIDGGTVFFDINPCIGVAWLDGITAVEIRWLDEFENPLSDWGDAQSLEFP